MTQEAKEKFMDVMRNQVWVNDVKMQEYANKTYSDVYETENGHLIAIEKSRIEKDFCFGYGLNGVSTQEDYEGARAAEEKAKNDAKYFINENLSAINEQIRNIEENENIYLMIGYRNQEKICNYFFDRYFQIYDWEKSRIVEKLSEKDKKGLLKMLGEEKERFTKRLNTYLKKYGTSKLRTWTYLVD